MTNKVQQSTVHVVEVQPKTGEITITSPPEGRYKDKVSKEDPVTPVIVPAPRPTPVVPNVILPDTYGSIDKLQFLRLPNSDAKQTTQRFTPYEQLTGILTDTPEIISVVRFMATHRTSGDVTALTDAGRYLLDQITMRELRLQNVSSLMNELTTDETLKKMIKEQVEAFGQTVFDVQSVATFLSDVVNLMGRAKEVLDLRNDIHRVDPSVIEASYSHYQSYLEPGGSNASNPQVQQFDIADVLGQLGFNQANVARTYSSTKLWLQMLLEYKETVRTHSLGLVDATYVSYQNDQSPGTLIRPNQNRFDVALVSTYTIDELAALQTNQVVTAIGGIATSFKGLYINAQFRSDEQRFSALATIASREYRLSRGLSRPDVQLALRDYGYTVAPAGNLGMLDAFIGTFGNSIADVPDVQTNALVSVALRRPDQNTAVLTFEEKYVEGTNGTLTPGSEYYIDECLRVNGASFNTTRLNDLISSFTAAGKRFTTLSSGLNLLMKPTVAVTGGGNIYDDPYVNPRFLFESITRTFIDADGNVSANIKNDPVCALLALSQGSLGGRLKATLFTLIMTLIGKGTLTNLKQGLSDGLKNDAVVTALVERTEQAVRLISPVEQRQFIDIRVRTGETTRLVAVDHVIETLKGSSAVIRLLASIMIDCRNVFSYDTVVNGRTRYSGYTNTVMLMTVFDLVTGCIAKYAGQRFLGTTTDKRVRSYGIALVNQSPRASIDEVMTRLNRETMVNSQVVWAIMNSLSKAILAPLVLSRAFESPAWKEGLAKVWSANGSNQTLVQALFSKQQMMMLASNISDMRLGNSTQGYSGFSEQTFVDVDGDGDYDFNDALRITDTSLVPPKLRDAVLGYLASSDLGTDKAFNRRIITVGVPTGMVERLNQLVNLKTTNGDGFQDRQSDIISINVQLVDMRNPDIIFKPISKLYELSRFPVRDVSQQPVFNTLQDYVFRFPTRDYSQRYETLSAASDVQVLIPGVGQTGAFTDDSYSFLSTKQKREIVSNVVESYILETYVRLLTGLDLSETSFRSVKPETLIDDAVLNRLTEGAIGLVRTRTSDAGSEPTVFFGSLPVIKPSLDQRHTKRLVDIQPPFDPASLNAEGRDLLAAYMDTLNTTSKIVTPLASDQSVKKLLLTPRRFDRVVSMIIDPDDFEVDVEATIRTEEGRTAYRQLVEAGVVSLTSERVSSRGAFAQPSVSLRLRSVRRGDISFEKYFVTMTTVGDTVT